MNGDERGRPRRWRRWLVAGVLVVAGVAAVLGAFGWWGLRSRSGRAWILAQLCERVERAYRVHVEVADFAVSPWRGVVEVRGATVGVPSAPPFLTVRRIRLEVAPRSLIGSTVIVRALVVEGPLVDLTRPIPRLPETRAASPPTAGPTFEVERARLLDGSIVGGALPPPAAPWVSGWRAEEIVADGSFRGGHLEAVLTIGKAVLARPRGAPVQLSVVANVEGAPPREMRLGRLEVRGAGLVLTASGDATLKPVGPIRTVFNLEAEPGLVAPELAIGGRITAGGELELRSLSGRVEVEGRDLALAAVHGLVPRALFDDLELGATVLDVSGEASGPFAEPEGVAGRADVGVRRVGRTLATGRCTFGPVRDARAAGVRVGFEASLLPSSPGRRDATGVLFATSWPEAARGRLEDGRLNVSVPDLAAALAEFRSLWPRLVPQGVDRLPLVGALEVHATGSGPVGRPLAEVEAVWKPEVGSEAALTASGRPLERKGELGLTAHDVRLSLFDPRLSGTVSATVKATGYPEEFRADLRFDGRDISSAAGGPSVDRLHLEAATDGKSLDVRSLSGALGRRRFAGSGRASLRLPLGDARLSLHLTDPVDGVPAADVEVGLHRGTLGVLASASETPAGPVAAEVTVPLAALRTVPGVGERLASLPLETAAGPVHVSVFAPAVDSCVLNPALGLPDRAERGQADVRAELWLDPADVPAAVGEAVISGLSVTAGEHRVAGEGPVTLRLGSGRLDLGPAVLRADTARLNLAGTAWLTPSWDPFHDAPASLVSRFQCDLTGQVPAPLANPYLAGGGRGSGVFNVAVHGAGTPANPTGSLSVDGSNATLLWPVPYATKITQLVVKASTAGRGVVLDEGRCRLNGGPVELSGRLAPDGAIDGQALFSDVRYRLEFGVWAVLSGELKLTMPPAGRSLLAGRVTLDRGWLTRDIDLEHELLPFMMAPPSVPGTETNRLDAIDLDVSLDTVQGVRVKNNLADLRASWEPLAITGTAWNPRIRGRVDVEPGGLLFAAGQVFRLDHASATFAGDPNTDPRLDFATTSSLQDPSIGRAGAGTSRLFQETGGAAPNSEASDVLSSGLASLLGQRAGETFGLGEVTVRPVPVWGEADPTARLTISRALSANAAFLVSLDLRNAQRQTYILDLHAFRPLPTLQGQVFTNDQAHQGATLQQTLQLGGGRRRSGGAPLLHRILVEAPPAIKASLVRGAVRLRPGDPVRPGAVLDAEVDVADALRSIGYSEAIVSTSVGTAALKPGRQDIVVSVAPGPRAEFRFAGDKLPAASRRAVVALYRSDYYEAESLQEMRTAAVRALRSLGHLDPEVEVSAERPPKGDGKSAADVVVTVTCRAGREVALASVEFDGVPGADARALAAQFSGTLVRTELAAGLPGADARVSESLRRLGYRGGRVVGREISADGKRVVVHLAPEALDRLASVALAGVSDGDEARLLPALPVHEGEPARAALIAAGAAAIAEDFRSRGFADVRVSPELREVGRGASRRVSLTYEVSTGTEFHLAEVRVEGLRWTSPSFARRLVSLERGSPLLGREVVEGRVRLLDSGLFSTVLSRTERRPEGAAVVTYTLVERPPFTVSYGVRWESDVGASGVVEFVDHNLLGRAFTGGVQLRYEPDDRSGRLYLGAPGVIGTRNSLEVFFERSRVLRDGLFTDASQATLQFSRPLGPSLTAKVYGRYSDTHLYEENPNPFEPAYDVRIRHPYVGVQLVWDSRDDPVMATRGLFASTDLSASHRVLGSDFHYVRWYSQVNTYVGTGSIAGKALTWGQSVRLGLARAFDQDLIPDARFYAGGSYSVRGYDTESLGPTEDLGGTVAPVGGAALLVINEELRVPLREGITVLLFFDAGQVWAEIGDVGSAMAKSFGLGLRAGTPLGLFRFDVARPLDAPPGASQVRFNLGFGNVF